MEPIARSPTLAYYSIMAAVGAVCWAALPVFTTAQELSTAEIARVATPATVTVFALSESGDTVSQGSGFLVDKEGVVVTNWHVIDGAAGAVVQMAGGEVYDRVRFLDGIPAADVALLQIPGFGLPYLEATSELPAVGEDIVVIGSPLGFENTVSSGIVSAVRLVDGRELLQVTAPISPGSSGGPVLDHQGRVAAIATAYIREGQGLNFAVPVRYALGLLSLDPQPGPFPGRQRSSARGEQRGRAPERVPSSQVREDLTGVYLATNFSLEDFPGWLLYVFPLPNPPAENIRLTFVDTTGEVVGGVSGSILTTSDGRIAVTVDDGSAKGSAVFEGYQTSEGLYWTVPSHDSAGLHFLPFEMPVSTPEGIYEVHCETEITEDGRRMAIVEWRGHGIVAPFENPATEGTYVVNFKVQNARGGGTGWFNVVYGNPNTITFRATSSRGEATLEGPWPPSGGRWETSLTDTRGATVISGPCIWRKN